MPVSSPSESRASVHPFDGARREPGPASSRLHVRLKIEKSLVADLAAEVIRLVDRFMPDSRYFLVTDGDAMTLRVRQGALRVCQTDRLACRLARVRGIVRVSAVQYVTGDGEIYRATLRGKRYQRFDAGDMASADN